MNHEGRVLAFDVDGVLADFTSAFTAQAARQGLVPQGWSGYLQKKWAFDFHVDPVWGHVDASPNWWEHLASLANDADRAAMWDWYNASGQIVYVTARSGPENVAGQTVRWLKMWNFPPGTVVLESNKPLLYGFFGDRLTGAIDDRPDTCDKLVGLHVPTAVRDWPYNRGCAGTRVRSLVEFIDIAKRGGLEDGRVAVDAVSSL